MRGKVPVVAAVACVAVAGIAAYVWLSGEQPAALLQPDDAQIVEAGQVLYDAHCAACHGAELEGQPNWRERGPDGLLPAPPHDETGHTWHHPDQMLFDLTKYGVQSIAGPDYLTAMPAYEGVLSDDEIIAVLSFIKSRWDPAVQARHDAINAAQAE